MTSPLVAFLPWLDCKVQEGSEVDCNLCGDTRIRGRRVFTRWNVFVSLCGNTMVDFRDSNLPEGSSLSLIIVRLCGDVKLYVQRGTQVKVCRVLLCGDKDIDEDGQLESSIKISVYILGLCGSVIVSNRPEDGE